MWLRTIIKANAIPLWFITAKKRPAPVFGKVVKIELSTGSVNCNTYNQRASVAPFQLPIPEEVAGTKHVDIPKI